MFGRLLCSVGSHCVFGGTEGSVSVMVPWWDPPHHARSWSWFLNHLCAGLALQGLCGTGRVAPLGCCCGYHRTESSIAHNQPWGWVSGWGLLAWETLHPELGSLLPQRQWGLSWPHYSQVTPKPGLCRCLSLPSLAFPRCSYLGENNCGRLCFQQMKMRKRLCDSSTDKSQPGHWASGRDGAPHQPLSPPAV